LIKTISRALIVALTLACSVVMEAAEQPRLVVVISLDQFPHEYLQRFAPYLSDNGFRRFYRDGAVFSNAYLPYANTYTAPGHASIGSGLPPREHGIIGNNWFDRVRDDDEYCVEDYDAPPSEGSSWASSPVNLAEDSLGDRHQERYHDAKVIGVSWKNRAAILMAGRKADAAYWFDDDLPGFISSTYYQFNRELAGFNTRVPAFIKAHPSWTQSDYIPRDALARLTYDPESLRKYKNGEFGVAFPHAITDPDSLKYTPHGNELVLDFAAHVIEVEKLGADETPDLFFVSLSSPDFIGHYYGPDSLEVADSVVRVDRALGQFLDMLQSKFGHHVTVAITSDHGVQSIPEVATALGRDAGRLNFVKPTKSKIFADFGRERRIVELAAAKRLGLRTTVSSPASDSLIRFFESPAFYFDWARIHALGLDGEKVKRVFAEEAKKIKGVAAAYTNSELMRSNDNPSPIVQSLRLGFRPDRSGDVLMVLREGYVWSSNGMGTTHGQPVERDQHIPVMFWGAGISKGIHEEKVSALRLATTLAAIFGYHVGEDGAKPLPCLEPAAP
jgi:predicted AlkP superfamily pyrophosphatase or phosphodiesterase